MAEKKGRSSENDLISRSSRQPTTSAKIHARRYNAQSGAIQGILSQMKDDMEKDLETSAEEEAAAAEAHAKLMETKRSDLALLEATLVKTKKNQGEDTMQLAEDQEERSETQLQLKADEKFSGLEIRSTSNSTKVLHFVKK